MRKLLLAVLLLALVVEVAAVVLINRGGEEELRRPRIVPQPEALRPAPPAEETGVPFTGYNRIGEATRAAAYRPDVPNRPLGDIIVHAQVLADDGPAAGVELRIDQRTLEFPRRLRSFDIEPFWTGKTDNEGRAVFPNLPPGRFVVRAMSEGAFAMAVLELDKAKKAEDVVLTLGPASGASGIVRTASGEPAPNVPVYCLDPARPENAPANVLFGFPVLTDPAGRFRFPYLPAPARFVAWQEGAAIAVSDYVLPATEDTRLVLAPGRTLTGRFILAEAGKPLANIRVDLRDDLGLAPQPAITGADGLFVFDQLRPVQYTLVVQSRDYALAQAAPSITVHAAGAKDIVSIPLERTGHLRGRMLAGNEDTPVTGVTIEAVSEQRGAFTTATDQGGYFFFEGLPPGSYSLRTPDGAAYGVLNQDALAQHFTITPAARTDGPTLRIRPVAGELQPS